MDLLQRKHHEILAEIGIQQIVTYYYSFAFKYAFTQTVLFTDYSQNRSDVYRHMAYVH